MKDQSWKLQGTIGGFIPYVTYIWKGEKYPADYKNSDGAPSPLANQDWCFVYGEREWRAGKAFAELKDDAQGKIGKPPIGRINCETGVGLP